MNSPHLNPDLIARCVAVGPSHVDAATMAHLRECVECRTALRDSRLWHALWLADRTGFANTHPVDEANREFLGKVAGAGSRQGTRRIWPWLAGSAAVAAATLLLVLVPKEKSLPDTGPVADAIRQTALNGLILIPGAESASLEIRPTLRSGFAPLTSEVDSALHGLASAYAADDASADLAVELIGGYLAVGQVGSASDFVRDARNRFPSDGRLLVLAGLVQYCQGNLADAEALLRKAREQDPRDEIATINLASVLLDAGRIDEAAAFAKQVVSNTGNDVVRARANRIIELTGSPR